MKFYRCIAPSCTGIRERLAVNGSVRRRYCRLHGAPDKLRGQRGAIMRADEKVRHESPQQLLLEFVGYAVPIRVGLHLWVNNAGLPPCRRHKQRVNEADHQTAK